MASCDAFSLALRSLFELRRLLGGVLGPPGRSWGALGTLLAALGVLLGRSWTLLGRSWTLLGALGRSWALLRRFWDALGSNLGPLRLDFRLSRRSPGLCQEASELPKRCPQIVPRLSLANDSWGQLGIS